MRTRQPSKNQRNDRAAANMIEYIMVSGVLMALLIVMMVLVNTNILEAPADRLSFVAFTDVGNGISTRIVDVYAIAPTDGTITTIFDIPDDIAGKDYFVEVGTRSNPVNDLYESQYIIVQRGSLQSSIDLAGIGASRGVAGNTTGKGMNRISYDSRGFL
jgi:hypothetical protein